MAESDIAQAGADAPDAGANQGGWADQLLNPEPAPERPRNRRELAIQLDLAMANRAGLEAGLAKLQATVEAVEGALEEARQAEADAQAALDQAEQAEAGQGEADDETGVAP